MKTVEKVMKDERDKKRQGRIRLRENMKKNKWKSRGLDKYEFIVKILLLKIVMKC